MHKFLLTAIAGLGFALANPLAASAAPAAPGEGIRLAIDTISHTEKTWHRWRHCRRWSHWRAYSGPGCRGFVYVYPRYRYVYPRYRFYRFHRGPRFYGGGYRFYRGGYGGRFHGGGRVGGGRFVGGGRMGGGRMGGGGGGRRR